MRSKDAVIFNIESVFPNFTITISYIFWIVSEIGITVIAFTNAAYNTEDAYGKNYFWKIAWQAHNQVVLI